MEVSTTGSVLSSDGTTIGYRQTGRGPGLILVHGAMQSSRNFTKLAAALSDTFTVYVPDRRGRGLSGPSGENFGIQKEVEDLTTVVAATGADNIFGLSSGALITLQTALQVPSLHKIALYEPPLAIEGAPVSPMNWPPRYEAAIARNDLAAAMVEAMKGTADREFFTTLPRFILIPLMRLAIKKSAKESTPENSLATLIRTVHFDCVVAEQMAGTIENFRNLRAEVLLIGGTKSALYLPIALAALYEVLPNVSRTELPGLGHLAADDSGRPDQVAKELKRFF